MYPCQAVVILDHDSDMALLEIGEIHGRVPIDVKQALYPENKIRQSFWYTIKLSIQDTRKAWVHSLLMARS